MSILLGVKRKGISNFIAVLLLMVLAVSAGVVIYAYTMGYLGGLQESELPGSMSLDSATCIEDTITIYVRNMGKNPMTIDKIYLDGAEVVQGAVYTTVNKGSAISEGSVGTITIVKASDFTSGKTYEVKLIALDNTQLPFTVKCK